MNVRLVEVPTLNDLLRQVEERLVEVERRLLGVSAKTTDPQVMALAMRAEGHLQTIRYTMRTELNRILDIVKEIDRQL
jgi:hypothetical protein